MGFFSRWRTLPLSPADQERKDKYFPHPLTWEDKLCFNFPLSRWEDTMYRTEAEAEPPGAWFSPFRQARRVPAWLTADHPFFTGELKLHVRSTFFLKSGAEGWQDESPIPKFTLNACIWLYEALCAQCMFERWRRGYKVAHDISGFIKPEITEDGWPIIDQEERDDGSVWAMVAEIADMPAAPDELKSFLRTTGPAIVSTPYKGKFELAMITPVTTNYHKPLFLMGYPLGRPMFRPVRLRGPDENRNPYALKSTTHGSAQWAWRDELVEAGMIYPHEPARLSGHSFLGRSFHQSAGGEAGLNHYTCWGGDGHRLIVGPPGSGKFTSAIAPLLLWSANHDSAFVLDVKDGEAARITGDHRATRGPVTVLDPFGISGRPSGSINPIDLLRAANEELVTTALRIADAMFLPSGGQDQHWDSAAKKMLAALLMHVGTSEVYAEEERNLRTVRNIVREHIADEVLVAMRANAAGDGAIAAEAKAAIEARETGSDRYLFSVIASLGVNIDFLAVPQILKATERTTFDPRELRKKVSTLYVVLPEQQLVAVNRWVRLIYTFVMEQLRELGPREKPPTGPLSDGTKWDRPPDVHVVLDEFPALGRFDRVAGDMALTRSLGVHMHVVVQSLEQLRETYGNGWGRFQGTSACTHILGVRDNFTAEEVSKLLGTTTVKTSGQSQTRGNSGGSQSESSNYAARALMTPAELLAMPYEQCLAVVGGMNPVRLEKVAYFKSRQADASRASCG